MAVEFHMIHVRVSFEQGALKGQLGQMDVGICLSIIFQLELRCGVTELQGCSDGRWTDAAVDWLWRWWL